VLEVAKKIPSKVQLEEVPRQNSLPTQFQENDPTYENVGVFFFARDIQRCSLQFLSLRLLQSFIYRFVLFLNSNLNGLYVLQL
jgi:hypothetical protein